MLVWRFNADGSSLPGFTGDGFVTYTFPGGRAAGTGLAFDAAGRILVCGVTRSTDVTPSDASASLWRYSSTGVIDTTLPGSANGVARFDERSGDPGTHASAIVILGDGKALASGSAFDRVAGAADLLIWKLEP
jgi:hypothetical protein